MTYPLREIDVSLSGLRLNYRERKIDRRGQAAVLNDDELTKLFECLRKNPRDLALFGACYFAGCRIAEACSLSLKNVEGNYVRLDRDNTKGKLKGRVIPMDESYRQILDDWIRERGELPHNPYLFPGRHKRGHIHRASADRILREACQDVGLIGVSTQSFRRSFITRLWNQYIYDTQNGKKREDCLTPKKICKMTGHRSIASLLIYVDAIQQQHFS